VKSTKDIFNSPQRFRVIARAKRLRKERNESMEDWGRYLDVASSTVHRWESPERQENPSARQLMQICLRCDISPTWLLFGLGKKHMTDILKYRKNHNDLAAGLNLTNRLDLACEQIERLYHTIESIRLKPKSRGKEK